MPQQTLTLTVRVTPAGQRAIRLAVLAYAAGLVRADQVYDLVKRLVKVLSG